MRYNRYVSYFPVPWLIMIILSMPARLLSQNYPVTRYTTHDGLMANSIRCTYKDSHDLLWIGSDASLCTYDGKIFKQFKSLNNIIPKQIWAITEDEYGNLWFGSYGEGLYVYDGKNIKRITKKNGLSFDYVRSLYYSKKYHCLMAGTDKGFNVLKKDEDKNSFSVIFSHPTKVVTSFTETDKFILITAYDTENPLKFYPEDYKIVSLYNDNRYYPGNSYSSFLTGKGDTILSHGSRGIKIYRKNSVITNDTLGQIFGITEDKRGTIWMAAWSFSDRASKGGIISWDGNEFRNFRKEFGITDLEVWSVCYDDDQDILWVGTLNDGLYKVCFGPVTTINLSDIHPFQSRINAVAADSGHVLWIAGDRNLICSDYDGQYKTICNESIISLFVEYWSIPGRKISFLWDSRLREYLQSSSAKRSEIEKRHEMNFELISVNDDKSILFRCFFGVYEYTPGSGEIRYISPEISFGILRVINDTLYMSGWGNTSLYSDYRDNSRNYFNGMEDIPNRLHYDLKSNPLDVTGIARNGNETWYSSWNSGLWMSVGMKLKQINGSDSTLEKNISSISADKHGRIIISTNTGVIHIGIRKGDKYHTDFRISSENGLIGNTILWMLPDNNGYLWTGTNKGLNCINLDKLYSSGEIEIRFIDKESGYTCQSSLSASIDQNAVLWIYEKDHIQKIDTRKILSSSLHKLVLRISSLAINNKFSDTLPEKTSTGSRSYDISSSPFRHYQHDIIIGIDVINYLNPGGDRFRHRLEGYDEAWSDWSESRQITYTNLPPGQYTFKAEAFNTASLAHSEPLELAFRILHPWWGLWYVQILISLLLLAAILFAIYRFHESRRHAELARSETEKRIAQLEMQALQAQMNPHFIFNFVNGMQFYILSQKTEEVLSYLSDFSRMVRASMANVSRKFVPLNQEIEFITSYLRMEKMRFPSKFEFEISCSADIDTRQIRIPPMLIQPFVENSIRHGFRDIQRQGVIALVFASAGEGVLRCTVTDNGQGRNKTTGSDLIIVDDERPHSTAITHARIRMFNKPEAPDRYRLEYRDLYENGDLCGLEVELHIPAEG